MRRIETLPFFIAVLVLFFWSCSPQKRLNRLLSNHPELGFVSEKIDTIKIESVKIDTVILASSQTPGLDNLLNRYLWAVDSVQKSQAKTDIKDYITHRNCLVDTLKIDLKPEGYCKVWQSGDKFYFRLRQPAQKFIIKTPQINIKHEFTRFWTGFFSGILTCFVLIVALGYWLGKKAGGLNG